MKIIYVQYRDPISWFKPNERYYESDIDHIQLMVLRVSGILIREDKEKLVLGEACLGKDNPKSKEWGVIYPSYRYVIAICKENIMDRQDFGIKEKEAAVN